MKYWLFQSNQVVGPYDREELASTDGFSAESLVCSEGRKGTHMGDWQRAGVVAELAETLLRRAKVPAGTVADPGSSLIPPEPTLRDLAVLGTLQEKVGLLENSLSQLQDDLQARDEEISGLKVDLDQKTQEAAALSDRLGDLEGRIAVAEALKEELAKTQAEQSHEAQELAEIKTQIDTTRSDIQLSLHKIEDSQERLVSDLKASIASQFKGGRVAETPAPEGPPVLTPGEPSELPPPVDDPAEGPPVLTPGEPSELPPPVEIEGSGLEAPIEAAPGLEVPVFDAPGGEIEAPSMEVPAFAADADAPALEGEEFPPPVTLDPPGAEIPGMDAEYPGLDMATPFPAPSMESLSTPVPADVSGGVPPVPGEPADAAPDDTGELVDMMAEPQKPKKKGRKGLILMVLLLAGVGGAGAALKMGMLKPLEKVLAPVLAMAGLGKKKAPASFLRSDSPPEGEAAAPSEAPGEAPDAAAADPRGGVPDRSQEAIEFVKNYPVPGTGKTLAQVLEGGSKRSGILSPWNVNTLGGDRFEVNFYSKSSSSPEYQFEVRLDERAVRGLTSKSQAAMSGRREAPSKPGRKPRPRRRNRASALSDPLGSQLLDSSLGESGAGEAESAATVLPAEPARPAGRRPSRTAPPAEEKPQDEESLDDLLLPG